VKHLASQIGLGIGPVPQNVGSYRSKYTNGLLSSSSSDDDNDDNDEEHEVHDEEDNDKGGTVVFTIDSIES